MTAEDAVVVRARARVGSVLNGKYRLDRLLGVGGMAAVYSATHLRNASRVAVKVLHLEFSTDRDVRGRFIREGYASNVVGHPGTVRVADDDVADGSAFLVMELLHGETVDARWERSGRRLGVTEVVSITIDVLDVLAAAHDKGIVWRDGKPENLFITRDGKVKVLDFGVARLREGSPTKTRSGSVFGTPAFMPPEQALGRTREVDAQSDLWAIGATAFTLLSGRYVHPGETAEEMLIYAATRPAPPLRSVAPEVPEPIAVVIDRALAFNKRDRWASARAMQEALSQASAPLLDDIFQDDQGKTQVAAPPQMTLPPNQSAPTVALPTLPAASSVAGVASRARPAPGHRTLALVAAGSAGGAVLLALIVTLVVAAIGSAKVRTSAPAASTAMAAIASSTTAASTSETSPVVPSAFMSALPAPSAPAPPPATTTLPRPTAAVPSPAIPSPASTPIAPQPAPQPAKPKRDPLAP